VYEEYDDDDEDDDQEEEEEEEELESVTKMLFCAPSVKSYRSL
jgi:hypothetical protein